MRPLKETSQGILDPIYQKKKRLDTTVVKQGVNHSMRRVLPAQGCS